MKFFEDSGGTFKVDVHDIRASDAHGVALITASGRKCSAGTDRVPHALPTDLTRTPMLSIPAISEVKR